MLSSLQSFPGSRLSCLVFDRTLPNFRQHKRNTREPREFVERHRQRGFAGAGLPGSVRRVLTVDGPCGGGGRPFRRKHSWCVGLGPSASLCDWGHSSSLSARLPNGKDTYAMQLWELEDCAGKHLALFQEHGGTFVTAHRSPRQALIA